MRIISGRFRGRDLGKVPDGVRPTTDRVRESLFSVLGAVDDLRVLDLFAGTGALGLECYSRGAASIVFVERSRRVARALQKRFDALPLDEAESGNLELRVQPAQRALSHLERDGVAPFDLVFVDPPYADLEDTPIFETLVGSTLLAADAMVVVEGPTRHALRVPEALQPADERIYGETRLTWLRYQNHGA